MIPLAPDDGDADADLLRWSGKAAVQIEVKEIRSSGNTDSDGSKDAPLETGLRDSIAAAKAHRNAVANRLAEHLESRAVDRIVNRSVAASEAAGKVVLTRFQTRDSAQVVDSRGAPVGGVKEALGNDGNATGLYVSGYASCWAEDRDGDRVQPDAFDETLKSYLADNPVLLLDHEKAQVLGQITEAYADDVGLVIKAFIPKPETDEAAWKITAYRDIKRGLRKAFSIGGVFARSPGTARNTVTKVDLFEISSVAVPSSPKALVVHTSEKGAAAARQVAPTSTVAPTNNITRTATGESLRETALRLARRMPRRPYFASESEFVRRERQQAIDEETAVQLVAAAKSRLRG